MYYRQRMLCICNVNCLHYAPFSFFFIVQWLQWGGTSARLFGWSAADWSRPATNKSKSSERKRKAYCSVEKGNHEQVGCWPVAAKRVGLLKKSHKQKNCFLTSQTRWSWQIKRVMLLHFCDEQEVKYNITGAQFRPLVFVMTCARCKRCPGLKMAGFRKFQQTSCITHHPSLKVFIAVEVCIPFTHSFSHRLARP